MYISMADAYNKIPALLIDLPEVLARLGLDKNLTDRDIRLFKAGLLSGVSYCNDEIKKEELKNE